MDYRKSFADWYKNQVANNVTPYSGLQGFSAGVEAERERIIALLDSLKCDCDGECGMVEIPFTSLASLIKGENE